MDAYELALMQSELNKCLGPIVRVYRTNNFIYPFITGMDNKKQIGDRIKLTEISRQQEEEENEECRIFAAAKRKMARLRMEKERQLHE